MKFLDKKAIALYTEYIKATYEEVEVHSGECRYNFRCFHNAVHEAIRNGDKKIALVFEIDNFHQTPSLHVVNCHKGKLIDNTLGEWSKESQYFFIKYVPKESFFTETFTPIREKFRQILPFWVRIFSEREV